jgi:GTP pyrophosphokinase
MTGAIVNGRMVPYAHILHNGDIVKILTSNSAKGPSRDWLDIVKSPEARNKIRQWFKKEKREENIIHGKLSFEAELRHANITMADVIREDIMPKILSRASFGCLDEMYAAIGYGGISALKIVNKIRDELRIVSKTKKKDEPPEQPEPKAIVREKPVRGVMVEGLDNCLIKFARCCSPVPGDPVVGFITRGYGVSVHRRDCHNYIKFLKNPGEEGRWVRVTWAVTEGNLYSTLIHVQMRDRTGIVVDVASVLNALNVKISSFNARASSTGDVLVSIVVDVANRDELISAMAKLMAVPGVTDVRRGEG